MDKATKNNHSNHISEIGSLVWARLKKTTLYWPGIIVPPRMCGLAETMDSEQCVFWYGDHRVSKVPTKYLLSFEEHVSEFGKEGKSKSWNLALLECLEEYAERKNVNHRFWTLKEALKWIETKEEVEGEQQMVKVPNEGREKHQLVDIKVPEYVKRNLEHVKLAYSKSLSKKNKKNKRKDGNSDDTENGTEENKINRKKFLTACLMCYEKAPEYDHPIFNGYLCKACVVPYKQTFFFVGVDHKKHNCIICGKFGLLILCSSPHCFCTYCKNCVSNLMGERKLNKLLKNEEWFCFLCEESICDDLKPRPNWRTNMNYLYKESVPEVLETYSPIEMKNLRKKPRTENGLSPTYTKQKGEVCVLSVIDGEGSGFYQFEKLGFSVKKHFIYNIGNDNSQNTIHNPNLIYVHNFNDMMDNNEFDKVDMVVGSAGSISNNWYKEDNDGDENCMNGFEKLFFEFFRILQLIQTKKAECLFLFDSPATIYQPWYSLYSKFLNDQPVVLISNLDSARNKYRFCWENLKIPPSILEEAIIL